MGELINCNVAEVQEFGWLVVAGGVTVGSMVATEVAGRETGTAADDAALLMAWDIEGS